MVKLENKQQHAMCILQLTRIGDVIQTIQASQELKKQHPELKLIFIGRKTFCEGLKHHLSNIFDKVFLLDLPSLFILKKNDQLSGVVEQTKKTIEEINETAITVSINLSFSKSSEFLHSMIKSTHKLGTYRDQFGNLQVQDTWSQFIYSNVMGGTNNPFSLVDLFKRIIGVKGTQHLKLTRVCDTQKILVHPFASSKKKKWNLSKWSELIYQTLRDNPKSTITVVGSQNESADAIRMLDNIILKKYNHRISNLVGMTTLLEIEKELDTSALFIGHDSMVGHLASLNNVPTLTVSLGTVRPHETTPYGNNINITPKTKCFPCNQTDECDHLKCHNDVSFKIVGKAISIKLNNEEFTNKSILKNISPLLLQSCKIYKSEVSNNGMQLNNLSCDTSDLSDSFKTFYSILWKFVLESTDLTLPFPSISDQTYKELVRYVEGIENLYELYSFGIKYSGYILDESKQVSPSIEALKNSSKKLEEVDQLSLLLKNTFPLLAPLVDYCFVTKSSLTGNTVVEMAQDAMLSYEKNKNSAAILYDLIEKTLQLYEKNNRIQNTQTTPSLDV